MPAFAVCTYIATSPYNQGAALPGRVQTSEPGTLYVDSSISILQAILVQPNTAEMLISLLCCLLSKLQDPISDGDLAMCIASMCLASLCNRFTAEIACCSLLGTTLHIVVDQCPVPCTYSLLPFKCMHPDCANCIGGVHMHLPCSIYRSITSSWKGGIVTDRAKHPACM